MNVIIICSVYFIAAATPGPSQVFILEKALSRSRREARLGALGVSFGTLLWVLVVLLGIKNFVAYLPTAREFIRYLCVALLFYFVVRNIQALRSESSTQTRSVSTHKTGRTSFIQGTLVNILNPNSVVFFMTLFAPLITGNIANNELYLSVIGVTVISILWYQLLAELSRFKGLYAFLQKQGFWLKIIITCFYFYWALRLLLNA